MKLSNLNKTKNQGGFTLIEIMVVLAVLGIMATGYYMSTTGRSNAAKTMTAINEVNASVYSAVTSYSGINNGCAGAVLADLQAMGLPAQNSFRQPYTVQAAAAATITVRYAAPSGAIAADILAGVNPDHTGALQGGTNVDVTYNCL